MAQQSSGKTTYLFPCTYGTFKHICYLLCLVSIQFVSSQESVLHISDTSLTLKDGATIQLQCGVQNSIPGGVFTWEHNRTTGESVFYDVNTPDTVSLITVTESRSNTTIYSNLVIPNASPEDSGTISCQYLYQTGVSTSRYNVDTLVCISPLPDPICFSTFDMLNIICTAKCIMPCKNVTLRWFDSDSMELVDGNFTYDATIIENSYTVESDSSVNGYVCIFQSALFPDGQFKCTIYNKESSNTMLPNVPSTTRTSTHASTESTTMTAPYNTTVIGTTLTITTESTTSRPLRNDTILTYAATSETSATASSSLTAITNTSLPTANGRLGVTMDSFNESNTFTLAFLIVVIVAGVGGMVILISLVIAISVVINKCKKPRQNFKFNIDLNKPHKTPEMEMEEVNRDILNEAHYYEFEKDSQKHEASAHSIIIHEGPNTDDKKKTFYIGNTDINNSLYYASVPDEEESTQSDRSQELQTPVQTPVNINLNEAAYASVTDVTRFNSSPDQRGNSVIVSDFQQDQDDADDNRADSMPIYAKPDKGGLKVKESCPPDLEAEYSVPGTHIYDSVHESDDVKNGRPEELH